MIVHFYIFKTIILSFTKMIFKLNILEIIKMILLILEIF